MYMLAMLLKKLPLVTSTSTCASNVIKEIAIININQYMCSLHAWMHYSKSSPPKEVNILRVMNHGKDVICTELHDEFNP